MAKEGPALADTLTAVQHPSGFYPTWMNHKPSKEAPSELKDVNYGGIWPNCSSYVARYCCGWGSMSRAPLEGETS